MTRLEQIQTQIDELRAEANEISREAWTKEHLPEIMGLVGSTWIYPKNSYSCPTEGEYWPTYRRLIAVVESETGATLLLQNVQVDYRGTPSISIETAYVGDGLNGWPYGQWRQCPNEEFDAAYIMALQQIHNPERLRKYYSGGSK